MQLLPENQRLIVDYVTLSFFFIDVIVCGSNTQEATIKGAAPLSNQKESDCCYWFVHCFRCGAQTDSGRAQKEQIFRVLQVMRRY